MTERCERCGRKRDHVDHNSTRAFNYHPFQDRPPPSAEAHARTGDPDTSHQAARQVDAARLERVVVEGLMLHGACTTKELAPKIGVPRVSVSPRMAPLERKGLVRRTGERRGRSIVWAATEDPVA